MSGGHKCRERGQKPRSYTRDKPAVFRLVDRGLDNRYAIPAEFATESTARLLLEGHLANTSRLITSNVFEPSDSSTLLQRTIRAPYSPHQPSFTVKLPIHTIRMCEPPRGQAPRHSPCVLCRDPCVARDRTLSVVSCVAPGCPRTRLRDGWLEEKANDFSREMNPTVAETDIWICPISCDTESRIRICTPVGR